MKPFEHNIIIKDLFSLCVIFSPLSWSVALDHTDLVPKSRLRRQNKCGLYLVSIASNELAGRPGKQIQMTRACTQTSYKTGRWSSEQCSPKYRQEHLESVAVLYILYCTLRLTVNGAP